MTIKLDDQHYIEYVYTISDNYLIDFSINTKGINEIIKSHSFCMLYPLIQYLLRLLIDMQEQKE